ncbi:sortase [Virgisporangium aurantiacum]|uniref:Sortase n=1 Tax=Virgisporangium aurantiacum TaxID=175570 RepID=A0A8J3YYR7_9ACTN|nr:sortase [Virgisporangium aurantiacum]GIJ54211.1 sortase [Virgisporangium aurantiacum]
MTLVAPAPDVEPAEPGETVAEVGPDPDDAGEPDLPAEPVDAADPAPVLPLALYLPGAALSVLAVLILGFLAQLTLVSQLAFERRQEVTLADFRIDLATGTAPVGQADQDGRLVPPGTAVAVLRIPALKLRTVVFEGTTGGVLQAGPGHRRDTVLPGQSGTSVVMGRRAAYGGPFGRLNRLLPGDGIHAVTGQGEHTYRVTAVRRPGEPLPAPPESSDGRLVLVTADGPRWMPTDLLYVYADLTSPAQPAAARRFGTASLPPSEQALATDRDAWMPLVLWTQLLLVAALGLAWARVRWGRWQAWIVGVPVLLYVGASTVDAAARLLPNLL